MQKEEWKNIPDYDGLYQASTFGRVRSIDRVIEAVIDGITQKRLVRGKVLSGGQNGHGYLFVYLSKNGKVSRFYIHRLIAITFIPNPFNYPCINHKDENPYNNYVDNLEWCTQKYNANYGSHIEKVRAFMLSDRNPNRGKHRPEAFKEKAKNNSTKAIDQDKLEKSYKKLFGSNYTIKHESFGLVKTIEPKCALMYYS